MERRHLAEVQIQGSNPCAGAFHPLKTIRNFRNTLIQSKICYSMDREKIHDWTDRLVGPALLVILIVVLLEVFMPDLAHKYHTAILIADYSAISVFIVDLSFKFNRASTWEGFLKHYWLEIIAIMPGFIVFRILETFFVITRSAELSQDAIHLATRSERLAAVFSSGELSRVARIERLTQGLTRTPRFAKAAKFYDEPSTE